MAVANNLNVLKAAREELSLEAQSRISPITSDNLQKVYDDMLRFKATRNSLVPSMIEKIGMQTVDSMAWRNPFNIAKKDPMRYGRTDEETYINFAKGKHFNPRDNYENAFQIYQSYIMSVFHRVNFEEQYPVTVSYDNLRTAFQSEFGIRDMISAKLESAISGYNWDEYKATVGLIDTGYDKEVLPAITVKPVVNQETADELLTVIKSKIGKFAFPLPENNIAGATSFSAPTDLLWITTPETDSVLSVRSLAYMFDNEKADIRVHKVIVDKFEHAGIQGVLADLRFFRIREQFKEMSEQNLASSLNWDYFLTVVEQISASPFYPICVFTTDTVVKMGFTITTENGTYKQGEEIPLNYTLTGGTGTYHEKLVDIVIKKGNTSKDTYVIEGTNIVHFGDDETGSVVFTITSRVNPRIFKDVTYTKGV